MLPRLWSGARALSTSWKAGHQVQMTQGEERLLCEAQVLELFPGRGKREDVLMRVYSILFPAVLSNTQLETLCPSTTICEHSSAAGVCGVWWGAWMRRRKGLLEGG